MTIDDSPAAMTPLEAAILRTILYADVFDFPLTIEEIHHFLIYDAPVSCQQVEDCLLQSTALQRTIIVQEGYVALVDRALSIHQRIRREAASAVLWPQAVRCGRWLARLPFVRMVALTGALAMRNAGSTDDDLDYLVVTTADRVWLARLFAVALVRLVKLRGPVICPNYVLAEDALEQDRKDLFIAHEIAQMIPLCGHPLYHTFRDANRWASAELPNAQTPFYHTDDDAPQRIWWIVKASLERLLGGKAGDMLERWEYRRKMARFAAEAHSPESAAQLDEHHIKGHFNDYGGPVLRKYQQRLRDFGLIEAPQSTPSPGD